MKYGAVVLLRSDWLGTKTYLLFGDTLEELVFELEQRLDIPFLLQEGNLYEPEHRECLLALQAFYDRYTEGTLTLEDYASMDYSLKFGQIHCLAVAVGQAAIAQLQTHYPEAETIRPYV